MTRDCSNAGQSKVRLLCIFLSFAGGDDDCPIGSSRNTVHVTFKVRFTVVEWPVRGKWFPGVFV